MEAKLPLQMPVALDRGFDGLYGLELTELSDEVVRGRVAVSDEIKQPAGLVHGGVFAAIAESLASYGTASAVLEEGKLAAGLSNQTSFLRPITDGSIEAVATRRHRGRTTWVWEVEVSDDQGRLCVLSRVTIAVRESSSLTCPVRAPPGPARTG
jgi:1,4-dihydroxy-2-naphthoyl-CoA hydrolase